MDKKFEMNGGNFAPQGYLKINEGGSHEENPNGGVQLGADEQGIPNMVEEGESVYKDFVYSDRITVDAEMVEKHHLPKWAVGKKYSEVVDKMIDDMQSPGDAIENNGLNAMLTRTAEAQEEQKAIEQQKELEKILENMSPEELAALSSELDAYEQQTAEPVPTEQEIPVGFAFGGPVNKFANAGYIRRATPLGVPEDTLPLNVPAVDLDSYRVPVEEEVLEEKVPVYRAPIDWDSYRTPVEEEIIDEEFPVYKPAGTQRAVAAPAALPTIGLFAEPGLHAAAAIHNIANPYHRYSVDLAAPVLPSARLALDRVGYTPEDPNININRVDANNAALLRSIAGSGSGASTGALLLAGNNQASRARGEAFLQSRRALQEARQAAAAFNNNAAEREAALDASISQARAHILNNDRQLRARYNLLRQQLNDASETQQYQAIAQELEAVSRALYNNARTNFAMNQVNSNTALGGYWVDQNGVAHYGSEGGFLRKVK